MSLWKTLAAGLVMAGATALRAASGDPQIKTDHPFYPGELSCSTFERLFKTQAETYERATGKKVVTDEDKALASWYWRNLHYAHGEEGKCDLYGQGFNKTEWNRDYWAGLFAHGFGLCGTTHAQWTAEMDALLGHCRSRSVGVSGHNSFEVYLTGGAYGAGKWVLLDHDISTVIFSPDGSRLMGIDEIVPQIKTLKDPGFKPDRQRGWRVSGLADEDAGGVYTSYRVAEYLAGYAGPPPMVNLRAGETMTRYLKPGLNIGDAYVFWGRNYNTGGIPGPQRDRTWVNQPEKMYGSKKGTGAAQGQVRYGNVAFNYAPDFASGSYKEAVVDEDGKQITFEFRSPYTIACTPPNDKPWGIYDPGGKNGLVIYISNGKFPISISTNAGKTWNDAGRAVKAFTTLIKSPNGHVHGPAPDMIDATDLVKGQYSYLLRIAGSMDDLKKSGLSIQTICQTNVAVIPHLHDGMNQITFAQSNQGLISAGPTLPQAEAHVVDGKMGSPSVTLELTAPRGEKAVKLYAASWQSSGAPPRPEVKYQIDFSADAGQTWKPVVKDWQILRRQPEPTDYWSQSFTWGDIALPEIAGPVRVRFTNSGGKTYRKVEAHLAYANSQPSPTQVTFSWKDSTGQSKTAAHTYAAPNAGEDASWSFDAGQKVETQWVEYSVK